MWSDSPAHIVSLMTGNCSSIRKVSLMANAKTAPTEVQLTKMASIDDVFLALRTPFMGTEIEVTDEIGRVYKLKVQSLYHEDGSGRSIAISGYARLVRTERMKISNMGSSQFEACLNYKGGDRKGWIKVF